MPIDVKDLPPAYQAQALAKVLAKQRRRAVEDPPAPTRSKYGAVPTERAGIRFDSKKEARRYDELMAQLAAGLIFDLRLQETYVLSPAYTTPDGERIRAITYKADFTYLRAGQPGRIVEDVKSRPTRTKEYIMKRKMMRERLGIEIVEV